MRIAFLTRTLNAGGAERQLAVLAKGLRERGHDVIIFFFYDAPGPQLVYLRESGVRLKCLGKRGRWDNLRTIFRLWCELRRESPEILHGYLVVPNIITALLSITNPDLRVAWGVRAADMDLSHYDWTQRLAFQLSRILSGRPDLIITNSLASRRYHLSRGYPDKKLFVVPNGVDVEYFRRDKQAGHRLRSEWRVSANARLIGIVGRLDPAKDHPTFLRAAACFVRTCSTAKFVCVGAGPTELLTGLTELTADLGLSGHVIWAGHRDDLREVYSALDLATLSSTSESFPNAIVEAMACGVPVVATDVGDAANILEGVGAVVPPHSPDRLALAWQEALAAEQVGNAEQRRRRIVDHYSVDQLVRQTEALLSRQGSGH